MKKRILAAILAVAMVFGICTIASADDSKWTVKEWWGGAGDQNEVKIAEVAGADGQQTHVLSIKNNSWGTGSFGTICSGLDATKTYKFSAKVNYDIAIINLLNPNDGNAKLAGKDSLLSNNVWQTVDLEFTGTTDVLMAVQIQAQSGWNNATGYIDDITITDPDGNVVLSEDFEPKADSDQPGESTDTGLEYATVVYREDFEGETNPFTGPMTVSIVTDGGSKVAYLPGDPNWGEYKTGSLFDADASKEYTFKFRVKGSIAKLGIVKAEGSLWGDACLVGGELPDGGPANDGRYPDWKLVVGKASGHAAYSLNAIIKREIPSDDVYIDDIVVCEGDYVDAILANPDAEIGNGKLDEPPVEGQPTAVPTAEPTAEATTAPTVTPDTSATPSTTPTTEPTPTTKPTKKPVKSVKFTKKSVKIKKGKKVTLKVTIKGAKKATFSVDKKGKKVVKLSKKKAKSVVVTGKKKGKATITAKAAGKKATCKVTVK